ncbi:MAG: radical SAM protein [Deltaproteobacteria bacterium]|nr:radical SAM protein [Deltaproteobacteria bacterium]
MLANRSVTEIALGTLGLTGAWFRGRRPFIVNHLLTLRCNLACPFCYVSGPEQVEFNQQRYPRGAEMDRQTMRSFYRELIDRGFKIAIMLGGEPLLRDDLGELLEMVAGKLWTTVFTNGYLLADRHELVGHATNLFVSLDAPDEHHDELRGRPGSFQRALAGIEEVRAHHPSVKVAVNMTVTKGNVHRVGEMIPFARELGVPLAFQPPSYEGQFALDDRPSHDSVSHTPDPEAVAEAFLIVRGAAARGERIIGSHAFFDLVIDNQPTYPCHYPKYVLGPVMPNGDVVGCVKSRAIANVQESTVDTIVRGEAFGANAAAGPSCSRGCRDWGIHDLSAIRNRRFGLADVSSYYGAFAR